MLNTEKRDVTTNFTYTHNTENTGFEEFLINQHYVELGYTYPVNSISLKTDNYTQILKELRIYYSFEIKDFTSKNDFFKVLESPDFILTITGDKQNIYLSSLSQNISIAEKLYHIIKKYEVNCEDVQIYTTNYSMVNGSLVSGLTTTLYKDYENISKLYYPYIDTDSMFEQFYGGQESILILCGKPGIGKSKLSTLLLKYSLENPLNLPYNDKKYAPTGIEYASVAYVKSTEILAMDEFWGNLENKEFDLVILDDLDFFLTSRANEAQSQEEINKNKFLNQLLSFTDGISQNKTKFIISSNQPFTDIDTALLRKGRLFDILELKELSRDEALELWKSEGLSDKNFDKQNFGETILPSDLGSLINKCKNTKIQNRRYLKDPSVSKVKTSAKKLGF